MSGPSTDLIARIQRIEDINAIQALRAWYHRLVNDCEFEKIADLFTEDGVSDTGYIGVAVRHGREEIRASMSTLGTRLSQIKQFIHSHVVDEIDGDTAKGWAIMEARYGTADGVSYLVAGRYDDVYRRVDGKWLFQSQKASFYFSVPHKGDGWSGPERHTLAKRPGVVIPRDYKHPNPAL